MHGGAGAKTALAKFLATIGKKAKDLQKLQ